MPALRPNKIKNRLRAGLPAVMVSDGAHDPDQVEALGAFESVDGVFIDMEHGPTTWDRLSDLARAADLARITSIVRVPHGDPWTIGRTLDRGVQGVAIPHCSTREQAETAVRAAYFAPVGLRGMGPRVRRAIGWDWPDYVRVANTEILVVVLIEDLEAVANLEGILDVEGIDCFFVAPNDLSQSMGADHAGRYRTDPAVHDLVTDLIQRIVKAGRTAGTVVDDDSAARYVGIGSRLLLKDTTTYSRDGLRRFRSQVDDHGRAKANAE